MNASPYYTLLGSSPRFQATLAQIVRLAAVNATVLIEGETGTGNLNVLMLKMPALRERGGDALELVRSGSDRIAARLESLSANTGGMPACPCPKPHDENRPVLAGEDF
jgi:DNA-binding NtrC family response regulator